MTAAPPQFPTPDRAASAAAFLGSAHPAARAERLVAERYRLDEMIGHGATGSVWAATDELLRRRVALKKLSIPRNISPAEAEAVRARTLQRPGPRRRCRIRTS